MHPRLLILWKLCKPFQHSARSRVLSNCSQTNYEYVYKSRNTSKIEYNINQILFNVSKSQLIYFSKNEAPMHVRRPILRMSHGQMVPYVEKCIHFGNTLSTSSTEHALIDSAITDLNIKTNNLLSEFSFSKSTILSRLF